MRSRRSALPRRAAGTFVAFVTVGALIGGMALPAGAAINTDATAADLAAAIDAQNPTVVTGANLDRPPIGTPDAVSTTPLASFPTDGTGYDVLTTGDANLAGTGNTTGSSGANDNGATPSGRGNTAFDVSTLRVDVNVPGGLNCLRVDFRFLSEEFPEYVGSQYNDAFIAELDTSDWAASGPTITAPHNFAFDPSHNPISIDSTGFAHMTAGEAAGTTYDGATPLLVAQTPITWGPHSLYFSIFDQGDHVFDSAAFLDNMTLGTQSVTGCQKGAQPLSNVSLTVNGASSATVPAGFSDMPTSGFNYATLAGPGTDGSGVLATAPVNHGPVNHGPVNHGPV